MAEPGNCTPQGRQAWIAALGQPRAAATLDPVALRFVRYLRLIAIHRCARRDPVPELVAQTGCIALAVKALQLAEALGWSWPEPIQLRRFCCGVLSHDEVTIGALVEATRSHDRAHFAAQIAGLVRPERIEHLWQASLELVACEAARACGNHGGGVPRIA